MRGYGEREGGVEGSEMEGGEGERERERERPRTPQPHLWQHSTTCTTLFLRNHTHRTDRQLSMT